MQHQERFWNACNDGDEAEIDRLLSVGVDIDSQSHSTGLTPLQISAYQLHYHVAEKLLTHGANPNACGNCAVRDYLQPPSWTPLMLSSNDTQMVRLLLSFSADPNILDTCHGQSVLHLAAASNNVAVTLLLLRHGVVRDLVDMNGQTPLQRAHDNGANDVIEAWHVYEAAEAAAKALAEIPQAAVNWPRPL